jgi:hypothetical protein
LLARSPSPVPAYPGIIQAAPRDLLEAIEGSKQRQVFHDLVLGLNVVQDRLHGKEEANYKKKKMKRL